jgi:hypothetical protein
MIDPKELRLDNWVEYTPFTGIAEHIQINVFNFADLTGQTDAAKPEWKSRYNPIPLTPEILEKCGFENNGFYCTHSDPYMEISPSATGFILSVNCSEYEIGETFNHLHQLQNLYFALTGEELNYSPE